MEKKILSKRHIALVGRKSARTDDTPTLNKTEKQKTNKDTGPLKHAIQKFPFPTAGCQSLYNLVFKFKHETNHKFRISQRIIVEIVFCV